MSYCFKGTIILNLHDNRNQYHTFFFFWSIFYSRKITTNFQGRKKKHEKNKNSYFFSSTYSALTITGSNELTNYSKINIVNHYYYKFTSYLLYYVSVTIQGAAFIQAPKMYFLKHFLRERETDNCGTHITATV